MVYAFMIKTAKVNIFFFTLVCVHLELVIVGPVATSVSMLVAAVVKPFPPEMMSGGIVRSKDWPTIKTEAGATTEDRSEDAEC